MNVLLLLVLECGNGLGNALDFALSAQVSDQWQVFDDLFALKSRD